jgi:hypothetical protein
VWASLSWAWLLLECPYWAGVEVEREEPGEAALYGSAFHDVIARALKAGTKAQARWATKAAQDWHVPAAASELHEHVENSRTFFLEWLAGRNEFRSVWRAKGALIEEAVALLPGVAGRACKPHDEEHRYNDLRPGEIPGTLDFAAVRGTKAPLLVIDHKTGESEDFSEPATKPQLLGLGAAMMRRFKRTEVIIGVLHSRRRGLPKMYAERVKLHELLPYEQKLAGSIARVGDGSMRPGPWCDRCPAQSVCPARDSQLMERANDVLTGLTAAGGALSLKGLTANDVVVAKMPGVLSVERRDGYLLEIAKLAKRMAGRISAEVKERMIAASGTHLPETPSGETYILREYDRENISKDSIMQAFGATAGAREIVRLREAGAVRSTHVTALWPEKERVARRG